MSGSALSWYGGCLVGAFIWLTGSNLTTYLSTPELLAGSIVLGTIAPAYITFIIASCLSMLEPQTFILSNLIIVWQVAERLPSFASKLKARLNADISSGMVDILINAAILAIATFILFPLYWSRMLPEQNGSIYSGGSCWADLPFHMAVVNAFLTGRNQDVSFTDMHSPVFAGEKFSYPFIPDFHAAILVKQGLSIRWAFLLPALLLVGAFFTLMYYFSVRLTRSRLGALFGIILLVCAGGMGGVNFFLRDGLNGALQHDVIQDDITGNGKVFWFAFIPHILLPQRGATFAYPMALLSLILVWRASDASESTPASSTARTSALVHAAFFAALTPLVQAHTFMALGLIIATIFILDFHKWFAEPGILRSWFLAGLMAALVGLPQFLVFRSHVSHNNSFLKFGWIGHNHDSSNAAGTIWSFIPVFGGFSRFWWTSLGPAVFLFFLALTLTGMDAWSAITTPTAVKSLGSNIVASASTLPVGDVSAGHATGLANERAGLKHRGGRGSTSVLAPVSNNDDDDDSKHRDDDHRRAAAPRMSRNASNAVEFESGPDASLAEHLALIALEQLPTPVADVLTGRRILRWTLFDTLLAPGNSSAAAPRALDAFKFGLGAFVVFLFGNMFNIQPWDRDNCKLFYLWLFIASPLSGALLAAPVEYLFHLPFSPGNSRMLSLVFTPHRELAKYCAAANAASARGVRVPIPGEKDESPAAVGFGRLTLARGLSLVSLLSLPVILFLACCSGAILLMRESMMYHQLFDPDAIAMGKYIRENIPPKAVFAHKDYHIIPSLSLAGRPSLLAYTGWMWSHGYNYHDRDNDRNIFFASALKDIDDSNVMGYMRRWGVRYLIGDDIPQHHRPRKQMHDEAIARNAADPSLNITVPPFDENIYLDGGLKRVVKFGRWDLLEVMGYGAPPS